MDWRDKKKPPPTTTAENEYAAKQQPIVVNVICKYLWRSENDERTKKKKRRESDQKMIALHRLVDSFLIGAVGELRLAVGTWCQCRVGATAVAAIATAALRL